MRRITLFCVLVLAVPAVAIGQAGGAEGNAGVEAKALMNPTGKWQVTEEVSPVDDSVTVIVKLEAEKAIHNPLGEPVKPVLLIRCAEGKTDAYIAFGVYLSTTDHAVLTRFDKEKAKTQTWGISTDYNMVFAPRAKKFTKLCTMHKKLYIQTVPYGENPVDTWFDLRGLSFAIKPLRKACKW